MLLLRDIGGDADITYIAATERDIGGYDTY